MSGPSLVQPYVHRHPDLGVIKGIARDSSVVQFRGIPFAHIPARFRQSALCSRLPQTPFDATQPGPFCPQTTTNPFPPFWVGPLPADHPILPPTRYDEFGCLNLNVSAPLSALSPTSKRLPVLVYIHGGAFVCGGNGIQVSGREIADPYNLIRRMMARGKPLVVVNINYRLGPLGFLASKELTAFNQSHVEPVGNYGLHDQRRALDWVSKFISGFGGDRENITVAGGSAGGSSCHWQAIFPDRKLKRAILSSGTALAIAALPISRHQETFDRMVTKFGGGSDGSVIQQLQAVKWEDLVAVANGTHWPCIDGEWIHSGRLDAHQAVSDMPDLLIGWASFEEDLTYAVFGARQPYSDTNMRAVLGDFLGTAGLVHDAESLYQPAILQTYNIENVRKELQATDLPGCAELSADVIFKIPPLVLAQKHRHGRVFLWNLQATSPFSAWALGYRKAHHAFADIMVFDVADDLVERRHRDEYVPAVRQLQDDWVDFCHGQLQWDEFVCGNEALGPVYTYENYGRGGKRDRLVDVVGERVLDRWEKVLKVTCI